MKYFLDTADQEQINKWKHMIDGVTSNPSILKKCGVKVEDFIAKNVPLFKNVFVQVRSVKEAEDLLNVRYGNNDSKLKKRDLIFKVPMVQTKDFDGFALLKELKENQFRTCATIVYDLVQFDFAAVNAAEFSILLHAKNESDYFLDDAVEVKQGKDYLIKTVAASFRNKGHIEDAIAAGCDYATVPPKIMEILFNDPATTTDFNKFYGIE